MGIFDRAKDMVGGHPNRADRGIDSEADVGDRPGTNEQHAGQTDRPVEGAPRAGNDHLDGDRNDR